jgi:predicted transglutaminase-like cysteine proteinase
MRKISSAPFFLGCLAAALVAGALSGNPTLAADRQGSGTSDRWGNHGGVSLSAARMPKWRAMYGRHNASKDSATWRRLVAEARKAPDGKIVERVNRLVNQAQYVSDSSTWGRRDYWAAPAELFSRGGDCEDFAIAKYMLLKELGIPTSVMRVVITRTHAVLAVVHDGRTMVLDNRRARTYRLSSGMMSRTVFAINDRIWWVNTHS